MPRFYGRPAWQKPPPGSVIDWAHPHSYGLVDAWLFNENSGNVVKSLFGFSGAITAATWHQQPSGSFLQFDGSAGQTATQYVHVTPRADYVAGRSFLNFEVRIACNANGGDTFKFGEIYRQDNNAIVRIESDVTAHAKIAFYAYPGGSATGTLPTTYLTTSPNVANPAWKIVHCVWDGSHGHIYLDGVEAAYSVQNSNTGKFSAPSTDIYFGSTASQAEAFVGAIDRILVWNRMLRPIEILDRIAKPYEFVAPQRIWFFGVQTVTFSYTGVGGGVGGGSAATSANPRQYVGTGGGVGGGSAQTSHSVPGGGPAFREREPQQKPVYVAQPAQSLIDYSKLGTNVEDIWLLAEGGGSLISTMTRGGTGTGYLTGAAWNGGGWQSSGPVLDLSSNPIGGTATAFATMDSGDITKAGYYTGLREMSLEILIRAQNGGSTEMTIWRHPGVEVQTYGDLLRFGVATSTHPFLGIFRTVPIAYLPNRWVLVHFVWRKDGPGGEPMGHIYFDGVEQTYGIQEPDYGNGTILDNPGGGNLQHRFGAAEDQSEAWPGQIGHAIAWSRPLTSAEVAQRFRDGYSFIRQPQPKRVWHLVPVVPPAFPVGYDFPERTQMQQLLAR